MGIGQFQPINDANPHIGSLGTLEETQEARVEALCSSEEIARKAVEALKRCDLNLYLYMRLRLKLILRIVLILMRNLPIMCTN